MKSVASKNWNGLLYTQSDGSTTSYPPAVTPTGVAFPRTAIIAMSGSGSNFDQSYPPTPYSSQVVSIGTNGYFASGTYPGNPVRWMGQFDVALIGGNWEGWDGNGTYDRALLVDAIKQITNVSGYNPATVWQYHILEPANSSLSTLPYPTWYHQVANESWYVYSGANQSGSPISAGSGKYEVNWAAAWPNAQAGTSADQCFTPKRSTATYDGSAEDPPQYAAAYFTEMTALRHSSVTTVVSGTIGASAYTDSRFYPNLYSGPSDNQMKAPNIDGFFLDNNLAEPYYAGYYDLQNNYAADINGSAAGPWLIRGSAHYFLRYQQIMAKAYPGRTYLNVCNFASWPQTYGHSLTSFNAMTNGVTNLVHGGVLEQQIQPGNPGSSMQGLFGAVTMIKAAQAITNFCLNPKQVIFNGSNSSATDYQGARYIICAALIVGCHGSVSNNSSYRVDDYVWYDEYGGNPGTNVGKGWLGSPLSLPTAAGVNGVWIALYQNGVVLWNPWNNGSQTITLSQINSYLGKTLSLNFIKGVQDPTLNSGNAMTSVTLADDGAGGFRGDGVVLAIV